MFAGSRVMRGTAMRSRPDRHISVRHPVCLCCYQTERVRNCNSSIPKITVENIQAIYQLSGSSTGKQMIRPRIILAGSVSV